MNLKSMIFVIDRLHRIRGCYIKCRTVIHENVLRCIEILLLLFFIYGCRCLVNRLVKFRVLIKTPVVWLPALHTVEILFQKEHGVACKCPHIKR